MERINRHSLPLPAGKLCVPREIPGVGRGMYFSNFRPFSDPLNARETVENSLFYTSAQRYDVFSTYSSQMSVKPAILEESASRLARAFPGNRAVDIKELGAGHGDSMSLLLGAIRQQYPAFYDRVKACASDGFLPVVENMEHSPNLRPFLDEGKLALAHEDMMGALPCLNPADYVRISYALTDLPEDMVKKEEGYFYRAFVRGYIKGVKGFATSEGRTVPAITVAKLLASNNVQGILDKGLDIRDIHPRAGFEVAYSPMDFESVPEGSLIRAVLQEITSGIPDTNLRLGLNSSKAVTRILSSHLKPGKAPYLEIFDIWTKEILPGMPEPYRKLKLSSVNSVNYPFLVSYLREKGMDLDISFEDWKKYVDLGEQYFAPAQLAKILEDPARSSAFFGRKISGASASALIELLSHFTADIILRSEAEEHLVVTALKQEGFSERDISLLFESPELAEPVKSQSHGYYGLYQIATIRRGK